MRPSKSHVPAPVPCRVARVSATTALAALCVTFAFAQEEEPSPSHREIDLDGVGPAERIYDAQVIGGEGFLVLSWDGEFGEWYALLRGADDPADVEVVERRSGALATLKADGRAWVWDRARYVPLIEPYEPAPERLEGELAAQVNKTASTPAGTPVDAYPYQEPDGASAALAVPQASASEFCAMGGALCPAVTVRGGRAVANVGVHTGLWWGLSERTNAAGHRLHEVPREDGVTLVDPDTGDAVGLIAAQEIALSPFQPPAPDG